MDKCDKCKKDCVTDYLLGYDSRIHFKTKNKEAYICKECHADYMERVAKKHSQAQLDIIKKHSSKVKNFKVK